LSHADGGKRKALGDASGGNNGKALIDDGDAV
jgi:hypothetical protein